MRALLLRSTMMAVAAALLVIGIPSLTVVTWLATEPAEQGHRMLDLLSSPPSRLLLLTVSLLPVVVGLAVGAVVARRQADHIGGLMDTLADRAESFGQGRVRQPRLDSGIPEVDRLDAAMSRRAAELAASLASSRDFAADASHQLRTPLTALLMRLDEISTTDDLDVAREEANTAIEQVERLARVVDDLRERNRPDDGSLPNVSLDSVIASLQREWQPAFAQARRSVRVAGERGLIVQASRGALAQILSTLLENTLAHGAGTVEVLARRSGPSVVVSVEDQGRGIDPGLAPHIFERAVSTSGSGLGLALARDLASSNGGRLELLSTQPAVFGLFLSEGVVR
ncbi:MAG: sensor histidine kinase [Nostocoides sp.]